MENIRPCHINTVVTYNNFSEKSTGFRHFKHNTGHCKLANHAEESIKSLHSLSVNSCHGPPHWASVYGGE